jgi:hypothetical protein
MIPTLDLLVSESRVAKILSFAKRFELFVCLPGEIGKTLFQKAALLRGFLQHRREGGAMKTGYAPVSTLDQNLDFSSRL